jgi:hypothetical protein
LRFTRHPATDADAHVGTIYGLEVIGKKHGLGGRVVASERQKTRRLEGPKFFVCRIKRLIVGGVDQHPVAGIQRLCRKLRQDVERPRARAVVKADLNHLASP